ncbi:MAG: glutamine--fructose-6-phosphate transaminase (isomerizing) [Clostridia bacterium]|nr:glutamine--fructose-6-phosphate transaminase (isomerizing) [Clostridia bacterium]
MCGIIGYTGVQAAVPVILQGLERLEYRGYDSAGMGIFENGEIAMYKTMGSPSNLKEKAPQGSAAKVGIGHTRWATHGAPDEKNAHPHMSADGKFAVVHNGIIENYVELKRELTEKGYIFRSETDTEVVAFLLEEAYKGDVKSALSEIMPKLNGSYALGILCSDYPDTIFCAKKSSPLFVGIDADGGYLASDVAAFYKNSGKIYKLGDNEIGIIKKDGLKVFDIDGCRIRKTEVKIREAQRYEGKGKYEHFMLKEIYEQPTAFSATLENILVDGKIKLGCLKMNREKIKHLNHIEFIACGSAYHAGVVGAYAAQKLLNIPAFSFIASEYINRSSSADENTLVVIISQSGETADTLAAMREAKKRNAKIVSIVNNELSTIAQESDCVILTKAGREVAVATTKAFSAQLAVIYALCIRLSYSAGKIDREKYKNYCTELSKISEKIGEFLKENSYAKSIAEILKDTDYCSFIGRGFDYCTAMEGALKLKEISYAHCEAYAAGELKHGTISLIENGTPVVAVVCDSSVATKTLGNIKECKARGAKIICITNDENYKGDADDVIVYVPKTEDIFSVSLSVLPLQLIAYYTAKLKGCSIDKPKNLAKSVTVE